MKLISIISPVYNEEGNIDAFFMALQDVCAKLCTQDSGIDYELIFVDDGSQDNSLERMQYLSKMNTRVHYVSFSRNFGHQAALKAGLDYAKGDAVISLDADLQHPVSLIPVMVEKWLEGYDVVYTLRQDNLRIGLFKRITSHCFYRLNALLSDIVVPDGAADFRLCDRKVVDVLKSFSEPFLFWRGLVVWSGFRQFAISYKAQDRQAGISKYTFRKMLILALDGILAFSVRPLFICLLIGMVFFLAFIILLVCLCVSSIWEHVFHFGNIIVLLLLLQFSILMGCLGIIGEYIGRLFIMGKHRPVYIVREWK